MPAGLWEPTGICQNPTTGSAGLYSSHARAQTLTGASLISVTPGMGAPHRKGGFGGALLSPRRARPG